MIVLTSNGLTSTELLRDVQDFVVEKHLKTAALVVTADNIYKEKNWNVERLKTELESIGLEVMLFDFDTDNIDVLFDVDVIEFNGGNPYYLLERLNKANIRDFLQEFSKNKLLIGMSAGSLVLQNSISLINLLTPEMNFVNLNNYDRMGLVDFEVIPHYDRIKNQFSNLDLICEDYSINNDIEVFRISNGEGISVIDNNIAKIYSKD